jgi:hypothetical protein
MNSNHPDLQVAAPTRADQGPPHHRSGQPPALLGGWGQRQHGKGLGLGELGAQRAQRPGVEVPERAAQRVDVPLAAPDQALVRSGQHLDRLGQRAVAGDQPWLCRSVRTRSASTLASPRSDLARELPWRLRYWLTTCGLTAYTW